MNMVANEQNVVVDIGRSLLWLVRHGTLEMVKSKLSERRNWDSRTLHQAINYAARNGRVDLIEILLACVGDESFRYCTGEAEPVTIGAILNRIDIVQTLLNGGHWANPCSFPDHVYVHATDYAVAWGNVEMLELMMEHGAKFDYGLNPLDIVELFRNDGMKSFILSLGDGITSIASDEDQLIDTLRHLEDHVRLLDLSDLEKALELEG